MEGGIIKPRIQGEATGKVNLLPFHSSKGGRGSFSSFNRKAVGIVSDEQARIIININLVMIYCI